jgi:hypothetical protein
MLLESDGTVLVHDEPASGATTQWWRLTPNSKGSYIDGTWSQIAAMPTGYAPLYFASAILPDGRMIVEGGEYNGTDPNGVWTTQGAIYSPFTNTWTSVTPPNGWTTIGDAQSDVLANGTFMLANCCSGTPQAALLNPSTLAWTATGTSKADSYDEEGWNLEPSNQLLTVDVGKTPDTELYSPSTGAWSSGPNTVTSSVNVPSDEIGPQIVMPGGNTFVVGAGTAAPQETSTTNSSSALYHYSSGTIGTWSAGPLLPEFGGVQYDSADGTGSVLPDGNVLFDVSAGVYLTPTHFFVYNASANTQTQVADTPNAPNDSTYYTRMLVLPTGQVLFDDGSNVMDVYTAGGSPEAAWEPTITSSPATVTPGDTYSLSGNQLAGLSQGAAYGDDVQDNTNFPLVRITNNATGTVTYARTTDWSSVSIAPGASSSTDFTVPASTPTGASTLVVVANGIASPSTAVTVTNGLTVTGVSPDAGPTAGGNTVTITGTGFVSGATVKFGGTASSSVTFVGSTEIKAVVPAETAGTVNVRVTTGAGTSPIALADAYAFGAPTITKVSPDTGSTAGGNTVTITGTGMVGGATVKFGGTASSSVTFVGSTEIKAVAPAETAGAVNVRVTTGAGTSPIVSADAYTFAASDGRRPRASRTLVRRPAETRSR